MQVETTVRYSLTSIRMAIIRNNHYDKWWRGYGEKGSLCTVSGMQTGTATMENSMEVPQKIKNRTIIQFSNSTS